MKLLLMVSIPSIKVCLKTNDGDISDGDFPLYLMISRDYQNNLANPQKQTDATWQAYCLS